MKEPAEGDLPAPAPLDLEVIPTPKLCPRELADALSGLKPRERLFCEHYCAKGNATEAARLAGWSRRSAYQAGYRLLQRDDIKEVVSIAIKASGADSACRLIRATSTAKAMYERMHDHTLPLTERSHASKVWHDAEAILAEVNKTSLRFEVQTPVQKPGQISPQLLAALAGLGTRVAFARKRKEMEMINRNETTSTHSGAPNSEGVE
jgi:hypothetical protein